MTRGKCSGILNQEIDGGLDGKGHIFIFLSYILYYLYSDATQITQIEMRNWNSGENAQTMKKFF